MATKKELIKIIKERSGETDDWGDLKSMRKDELEKISDYLEKLEEITQEEVVDEVEEEIVDEVEVEEVKEEIDPVAMQEYTIHKQPSELSKTEERLYARTGILPVKKK